MDKRTPSPSRLDGRKTPRELTPLKQGYHGTPELAESRLRQDFFLKQRYKNTLPDIPCEPKHQVVPLSMKTFEPPTDELKQFYDQFPDWDYGVDMNLVGYQYEWTLREVKEEELHPVDQFLKDDSEQVKNEKRTSMHSKKVTWLRRTEYISSEGARFTSKQSDKAEFRVDEAISRRLKLWPSDLNCLV